MYNKVLAKDVLEELGKSFPTTMTLAQLKRALPRHSGIAEEEWLTAIDALNQDGLVGGILNRASSGTIELVGPLVITIRGRQTLGGRHMQGRHPGVTRRIEAIPASASDQYRFHPEIERVSGQLYRDGYCREAVLNAYIRVIEEVRTRSGLSEDGDSLMNRALGCERRVPVVQFNSLQTEAERDEQKGLRFLFKGIVGLRNSKAHSNRLFNDANRGHEYLALASLAMRLLEIARVNPNP